MHKDIAPAIARIGLSLVILWFGINQLVNPENFMGYLPSALLALESAKTLVMINGIGEIILGALLLIGLWIRPVAILIAFHLLGIIISLGYNDIAVRDFGLLLVAISIALGGADKWTLEYKRSHS